MKIVFVDIDGVLNTGKNYSEYSAAQSADPDTNPEVRGRIHVLHRHVHLLFDKTAVENLNSITDASGAHIVVSSSWRRFYGGRDGGPQFSDLVELLARVGVKGGIVGRTPLDLARKFSESIPRGLEICTWLDCHPRVKNYVILDDENDMLKEQKRFFVKTDCSVGLTVADAERAIRILGR